MLSKRSTLALIATVALLSVSCSVSRQATSSSEQLKIESLETVERVDSVIVEQRDTLREVTTITIDRNDKGDTLKVVQITDLTRARSRDNVVAQRVKTEVRVDTVYVEKRDSVYIQNTNLTNPTNKKPGFLTYVKWITALVCAVVVLILVIRFGRRGLL